MARAIENVPASAATGAGTVDRKLPGLRFSPYIINPFDPERLPAPASTILANEAARRTSACFRLSKEDRA
jgi:hypothetical protein